MAREIIKNTPLNSGEGDDIKTSFDKVNANFEYLFDRDYTGDDINLSGLTLENIQSGNLDTVIESIDSEIGDLKDNAGGNYTAGDGLDLVGDEFKLKESVLDDIAKGVTAHGWGNHADAGYATETYVGDAIDDALGSIPSDNFLKIIVEGNPFQLIKIDGNNNTTTAELGDYAVNGVIDGNTLVFHMYYIGGDPSLITSWEIIDSFTPNAPAENTMELYYYVDTPNTNGQIELPMDTSSIFDVDVYDENDNYIATVEHYGDRFIDITGVEGEVTLIKLKGNIKNPKFSGSRWLAAVEKFGEDTEIDSLVGLFKDCNNLNFIGDDLDSSSYTDFTSMFEGCANFTEGASNLDVSSATTLKNMFYNDYPSNDKFDEDLSGWDVSNVKDMSRLFNSCSKFNQPIGNWDVSSVENMGLMFASARKFNQPLTNWITSSLNNMSSMFSGAYAFNQDISGFDISQVTNLSSVFRNARAFNQDLSAWDVSHVTKMRSTFDGAESFNKPLNSWVTTSLTDTSSMFAGASVFNQPLDNWDVSSVLNTTPNNMRSMFQNATEFDQDLSSWCVEDITSLPSGFDSNSGFEGDTTKQPNWGAACI